MSSIPNIPASYNIPAHSYKWYNTNNIVGLERAIQAQYLNFVQNTTLIRS